MAKCGGCGKFMSTSAESIRCNKCSGTYHLTCVGITATARTSAAWLCPGCKIKIPRGDNSCTPVKGLTDSSDISQPQGQGQPTASTGLPPPQGQSTSSAINPTVVESKSDFHSLDVAKEIRCFREELRAMLTELREFRTEMSDLRTDVTSCKARIDAVEDKVSCLEKRFDELVPVSYDRVQDTIAELKLQLNERDQDLLCNDLIITGIPEVKDESQLHLLSVISAKLGVSIDERDIVNVERLGMVRRNFPTPDAADARPRVLGVRLARRAVRDQLLRAARVRRGLTTQDLQLQGPPKRFYINERLTPTNSRLFHSTREAGQHHKFRYVWTRDGRIYVKKEDGLPTQRIRSEADISRVFGISTVG